MINFDINYVETYTIGDAWREVMWLCKKNGIKYQIASSKYNINDYGSYVGEYRLQLPYVMVKIKEPWIRPLSPIMPPSCPFQPTDDEKIDAYFANYLMNPILEDNEIYRYSTYIAYQINEVISKLISAKGKTNQSTISVGGNESIWQKDPPCLRLISFKAIDGILRMTVFFRSWDLVSGFPENLGGLQLLKEYVLSMVNDNLSTQLIDGEIIAMSDGLHIYNQYDYLVDLLNFNTGL